MFCQLVPLWTTTTTPTTPAPTTPATATAPAAAPTTPTTAPAAAAPAAATATPTTNYYYLKCNLQAPCCDPELPWKSLPVDGVFQLQNLSMLPLVRTTGDDLALLGERRSNPLRSTSISLT